jgi:DNA sulfur modification protein DndD
MRIKQLVLRNFGLYRGEQTLDLAPRSTRGKAKPIVLVGGHNGAGKTTVLEAVRVCLYGRLALGPRVTESDYQAYLRDRIHRSREVIIPVCYASVAIEFDYAHAGKLSTYVVQRAWETRGSSGVTETLRVTRDGEPLAEVESQFWPEFVRSLVPPGVSQLFFFDGEKIKRFADQETEADTLAESIKALLGLDLVERLQADLDLYNSRYLKKTATGSLAVRLAEMETANSQLQNDLAGVRAAEEEIGNRVALLAEQIERAEQQLAQRGEGLSAQRGELRQRKADLEARREQLEKALRDLCEGPLPFAFCPILSGELQIQLEKEAERERWDAARTEVRKALETVTTRLTKGKLPKKLCWDANTRRVVGEELGVVVQELVEMPLALANVERIHALSERVREQAQRTLADALSSVPQRIAEVTTDLNQVVATLREVQGHLNHAPEGDEIAPLVRQLSSLQEEHANRSLDLALRVEQRTKIDHDLGVLSRERERILTAQEEGQMMAGRLALAVSARRALDAYLQRLTAAKVEELQAVFLQCFQTLSRKNDLVHGLTINPRSFEVTLFDSAGETIPRASLSAGEKQIYAISLLWALAKVSGRALPMIIDTPLGRLDSVHRMHLLERYFPVASHQVIILSTDTEVDRAHFELLKPHTSHSVHLVSHTGGWTEASPGYFWKEATADAGVTA